MYAGRTLRLDTAVLLSLGAALLIAGTANAERVHQKPNLRFDPVDLTVDEGADITWVNDDPNAEHTSTEEANDLFDSGQMGPTAEFTWPASHIGDIHYVCSNHSGTLGMEADLHVRNKSPSIAITSTNPPLRNGGPTSVRERVYVSGTASDAMGRITLMEVSSDGGGHWETVDLNGITWQKTFGVSDEPHGTILHVRARATDDDNAGGSSTTTISVGDFVVNAAPKATFTFSPDDPTTSDAVRFESTSTDDHDIVGFQWWFDGAPADTFSNATHRFATKGQHNVTLTVTDDDDEVDNVTLPIQILNSPPLVNFSWVPDVPGLNESVQFTDLTRDPDGQVAGVTWDFGDGATSTQRNATHAYAAAGDYTVALTARDDDDAVATVQRTLTVEAFAGRRPVANLTLSATSGQAPLNVSFELSGYDPDGQVINWTLDFGDGGATRGAGSLLSGGLHLNHVYEAAGDFEAVLTVFDNLGTPGTNRTLVHTDPPPNRPPVVRFVVLPNTAIRKGQTARFNDTSTDLDPGDAPAAWSWDFGDGERYCCDAPTVDHTYAHAGRFNASLVVSDRSGLASVPAVIPIVVQGEIPRVALAANRTAGRAPMAVTFTLDARDPDGTLQGFVLDFGDGAPAMRGPWPPENATVRHLFEGAGSFGVTFAVTDDDGFVGQQSLLLDVQLRPPEPVPLPPGAISATPVASQRLTVRLVATTTLSGNLTYQWAFGDGHTGTGREVTYSYQAPGTYNVTLSVAGSAGTLAVGRLAVDVTEETAALERVHSEAGSGVVRVSWTADPRAAGYQVWRSDGGRFEEVAVVRDATSFEDVDVRDAVRYTYRVTFFSTSGDGRLDSLAELTKTTAFRLLGTTAATALVDSDHDGVRDSQDAFPLDASRSSGVDGTLLLLLGVLALAALGLVGWRRGALLARLRRPAPPRPLTDVPGLAVEHARILHGTGVHDTAMLADADPADVGRRTVLPPRQVAEWQAVARLLRLRGMAPADAHRLARAGIAGPEQLARVDPARLAARLAPRPPDAQVARWVRAAQRAGAQS